MLLQDFWPPPFFVLLLIRRCKRTALFWSLAVFGGMLGVEGLKAIIQMPRPASFYHTASTYGFPSGHTFMSMVIYGFLTIVVVRGLPCALRRGLGALALAVALFTALSRLYLGVHWLSDVLGGLLLGTAWIALLGIPYLKSPADVIPRRALAGVVLLSLLLVGSWHITQHHASSLADYAPRHESIQLTQEEWLDGGWQRVFPRRTDILRKKHAPAYHSIRSFFRGAGTDIKGRRLESAAITDTDFILGVFLSGYTHNGFACATAAS